jgi:hypothetical protein
MTDHDPISCTCCDATVGSVDEAIEAGWYPSFYVGSAEFSSPICEECAVAHFDFDPEPTLKPGHLDWLRATDAEARP